MQANEGKQRIKASANKILRQNNAQNKQADQRFRRKLRNKEPCLMTLQKVAIDILGKSGYKKETNALIHIPHHLWDTDLKWERNKANFEANDRICLPHVTSIKQN